MGMALRVLLAFPENLLGRLVVRTISHQPDVELVNHFALPADVRFAPLPRDINVSLIAADFGEERGIGFELLRRLRVQSANTRCVLMLEEVSKELATMAFQLGARGVLDSLTCDSYHLCHSISQVGAGQIWANTTEMGWIMEALSRTSSGCSVATRVISSIGKALLSAREREIVRLLAEGCTNRQIARSLARSEHTIKKCLYRIFEKAGVSSRMELMAQAMNASTGSSMYAVESRDPSQSGDSIPRTRRRRTLALIERARSAECVANHNEGLDRSERPPAFGRTEADAGDPEPEAGDKP
jgi:DNA-binding NarL/FixJ family response regulator